MAAREAVLPISRRSRTLIIRFLPSEWRPVSNVQHGPVCSVSGDPLRFHAHFIAVCVSAHESICVLDILAVARLGSNVKKTVLLCSAGPDADVLYTSVQWSGMA